MNQQLLSRCELFFWDFAIQALSRSRMTQSCLRRAYRLVHLSKIVSLGILLAFSGIMGLFSGGLLFVMMNGR